MSVLSELVRERSDWAGSRAVSRKHLRWLQFECAIVLALSVVALAYYFGGMPEPVRVVVATVIDFFRSLGTTAIRLLS